MTTRAITAETAATIVSVVAVAVVDMSASAVAFSVRWWWWWWWFALNTREQKNLLFPCVETRYRSSRTAACYALVVRAAVVCVCVCVYACRRHMDHEFLPGLENVIDDAFVDNLIAAQEAEVAPLPAPLPNAGPQPLPPGVAAMIAQVLLPAEEGEPPGGGDDDDDDDDEGEDDGGDDDDDDDDLVSVGGIGILSLYAFSRPSLHSRRFLFPYLVARVTVDGTELPCPFQADLPNDPDRGYLIIVPQGVVYKCACTRETHAVHASRYRYVFWNSGIDFRESLHSRFGVVADGDDAESEWLKVLRKRNITMLPMANRVAPHLLAAVMSPVFRALRLAPFASLAQAASCYKHEIDNSQAGNGCFFLPLAREGMVPDDTCGHCNGWLADTALTTRADGGRAIGMLPPTFFQQKATIGATLQRVVDGAVVDQYSFVPRTYEWSEHKNILQRFFRPDEQQNDLRLKVERGYRVTLVYAADNVAPVVLQHPANNNNNNNAPHNVPSHIPVRYLVVEEIDRHPCVEGTEVELPDYVDPRGVTVQRRQCTTLIRNKPRTRLKVSYRFGDNDPLAHLQQVDVVHRRAPRVTRDRPVAVYDPSRDPMIVGTPDTATPPTLLWLRNEHMARQHRVITINDQTALGSRGALAALLAVHWVPLAVALGMPQLANPNAAAAAGIVAAAMGAGDGGGAVEASRVRRDIRRHRRPARRVVLMPPPPLPPVPPPPVPPLSRRKPAHKRRTPQKRAAEFRVDSGTVAVSDPMFAPGDRHNNVLRNVRIGTWHVLTLRDRFVAHHASVVVPAHDDDDDTSLDWKPVGAFDTKQALGGVYDMTRMLDSSDLVDGARSWQDISRRAPSGRGGGGGGGVEVRGAHGFYASLLNNGRYTVRAAEKGGKTVAIGFYRHNDDST